MVVGYLICGTLGAIFGATGIVVITVISVERARGRAGEPLTKEEWKAGLNQDMKDRGVHL